MPPKKKKKSKATPGANGTARAAKRAAPERTPIELSRSKEKLPCPVDSETLQAKGDELAKVINERLQVKERKRQANATYREQIAYYDEREEQLAADISLHSEAREVDVAVRLMLDTQTVETVRLDTGEVVSTRPATSDDLQVEIATRDGEAVGDGAISKVFGGETFGLGDPDGGDAHAGASAP